MVKSMADRLYLADLQAAVQLRYKCNARHLDSTYVEVKTNESDILWQGDVEEFELADHDHAKMCYAWLYIAPDGSKKYMTVLASRVIDSAQKAVGAALFYDAMPPVHPHES